MPPLSHKPAIQPAQTPTVDILVDLASGGAAGAAGGLVASAVMNGFQSLVTPLFQPSGSTPPATELAAKRAAVLVSRSGLRHRDQAAGGTFVHYVIGTATGAIYGAMAERQPGVTRWQGLAFGLAAATLIDQIVVPLAGLARPPWRYTVRTHLYGYASHMVFGLVTEQVRKLLRNRKAADGKAVAHSGITLEDVALPLLIGLVNGQRTMSPPAAVAIAAASNGLSVGQAPLSVLGSRWTSAIMSAAAIGEFVADKQPRTPARITAPGLAGRAVGGALAGAAAARPGKALFSAAVATGGALAGAYISYRMRLALSRALGRDRPVAFAEDAIAIAGSAALAGYGVLRQKQRDASTRLRLVA